MGFLRSALRSPAAWALVLVSPSLAIAETPKDTLVIGWDTKPKSGDPRLVGVDANSQYIEELRFMPLLSFDENGAIRKLVAEDISPGKDNTWKVRIKKGIRFANGKELKADDVVATYKHIMSPSTVPPSPRKGSYDQVLDVTRLGQYEVQFTLKAPAADFVSNLVVGILPAEALKADPEKVTGFESGPYRLEKAGDDEWVLVRNEKFSSQVLGIPMPKLPKVVFKIVADNGTRFAALVKGDIDLVQNTLSADKILEVRKDFKDKIDLVTRTQLNTVAVAFNLKDPVFSKLKVRQAIQKAIDRDEILQFVLQGTGIPATNMFPPGNPFRENSIADVKYDPQGAMKLLDEAGFKDPDGRGPQPRLSFTMKSVNNQERVAIAKAIAGQLKAVGINMEVEALEFGTFNDQLGKGNVALWVQPWTGFKDPSILEFAFHSAKVPPNGGNRGFYSNPKLDELLDKGRTELNSEKRLPYYLEAQKILAADVPYVYLWHRLAHVATRKGVNGYKLYADGRYISIVGVTKN